MSTGHVSKNPEVDILSIIRELDSPRPVHAHERSENDVDASSPDPAKLLESLQKKRDLISLLGGYADVSSIGDMKAKLNEAIADLEEIIEATS